MFMATDLSDFAARWFGVLPRGIQRFAGVMVGCTMGQIPSDGQSVVHDKYVSLPRGIY
jgi:hypothetical protein